VRNIALLEALDADMHAIISITSATQDDSPIVEDNRTFPISGVNGNILICSPNFVGFPSLPNAPNKYNNSKLRITLSRFGLSRNGKFRISSCPCIFNASTIEVKSHSLISGVVLSAKTVYVACGYNR
jgi:hypothetical protein